jgi:DNA-directed RNA polymerase specialized sigma24 family protein
MIDWVDDRLRAWARWAKVGTGAHLGWAGESPVVMLMKHGTRVDGGVDAKLEQASQAVEVETWVCQLSEPTRQTVRVYYLHEWSMARVGKRLGCSSRTIKNRIDVAHGQFVLWTEARRAQEKRILRSKRNVI